MKVYLAARYTRREELCGYAEQLRQLGLEVTSRWLEGNHELPKTPAGDAVDGVPVYDTKIRGKFAREDYLDCLSADVTISFTEEPRSSNGRGGRHVEFGIALANGQHVIVVGHRENVFHCLEEVEFCETWADALTELKEFTGYE